jgi:large subunit ribosomal protein L28
MARRCTLTGKGVQYGHKVSHSNRKAQKRFKPNMQKVGLYSDALGQYINLSITPNALRSVDKNGGLDTYLLGVSSTKLPEEAARLQKRIKKALANKQAA